jgi:hypothetical protein
MKLSLSFALAGLFVCAAEAQVNPFDSVIVQSVSGQFSVVELRAAPGIAPSFVPANNADYVSVDADRLAVACERIREALDHETGENRPWQGKIHIFLHPAPGPEASITIVSEKFPEGWSYRLDVPDTVERTALVRAIVSALLLEQANRQADSHSAGLPAWLTEGLTQQLIAAANVELIPPSPHQGVSGVSTAPVSRRMKDPFEGALVQLRAHPPLTLKELSWPDDGLLDGDAGVFYRANAQLFVYELLQLPDGRASLRNMLDALPNCYNWQTAFFASYGRQFSGRLDLEKWWALQIVHFTGPNPNQLWSVQEGWERLDEIVHASVQVRQTQTDLPAVRRADLRDVIRDLDCADQKEVLNEKLQELDFACLYSVPDLAALADDYRHALAGYLKQHDQMGGASSSAKGPNSTLGILVNGTLQTLDALEARRAALRPKPALTNTAQAGF